MRRVHEKNETKNRKERKERVEASKAICCGLESPIHCPMYMEHTWAR